MIPLFPSFFFLLLFSNPAFLPSLPPDTCLGEQDSASDLEESSLVTVPPPPPPGQIDSDANNPILGPESEPIIAILNITGVRLDEVRFFHHWAVSFFFQLHFFLLHSWYCIWVDKIRITLTPNPFPASLPAPTGYRWRMHSSLIHCRGRIDIGINPIGKWARGKMVK